MVLMKIIGGQPLSQFVLAVLIMIVRMVTLSGLMRADAIALPLMEILLSNWNENQQELPVSEDADYCI